MAQLKIAQGIQCCLLLGSAHTIVVQGVRKTGFRAIFVAVTLVTGVQSRDAFSWVFCIYGYGRLELIT